ncbi:MAG: EamA family transporter, partial [Dehalococcoidales bacterium]|nr:EamA family transporter [Dehalococcoidales bacterium]
MKVNRMNMFALTLVFIAVLCAATGQIAMKSGMKQVGEIQSAGQLFSLTTVIRMFTSPAVLVGIFLYVISLFLWLGALSTLNVSLTYPLVSLAYVITAIVAFIFLKEKMTPMHWLGIGM